jgi:hypothetical protein
VATERTSRSVHLDAVARARQIRGSVSLEPADSRRWSAIAVATDGSLELRVAEPQRRGFWRKAGPELDWLAQHGFAESYDCWVVQLDAATGDAAVADRWIEALAGVHGLEPSEVEMSYVGRGVPVADVPPASAPHEEHLTAALHALARGEYNRMNVFGGRPSSLWAWVWDVVDEPGLRVERQHRDDPDNEIDTWHVPRTLEGCREGAEELLRQVEGDWPGARRLPLFIHLLTPRDG